MAGERVGLFRLLSSGWCGLFAGFIKGAKMDKRFDADKAVDEVMDMLDNREVSAFDALVFIRLLIQKLTKKYNFKL